MTFHMSSKLKGMYFGRSGIVVSCDVTVLDRSV